MTVSTPKQAIIEHLNALQQDPALSVLGLQQAPKAETIHFLRERSTAHRQLHVITFEDASGKQWHYYCHVVQDETGNWYENGAAGGSGPMVTQGAMPGANRAGEIPWVNLGGGGNFFYGTVVGNGVTVERVRLVSTTGHTLEDVPEQNLVLFLADESFDLPIEVELYGPGGNLVGKHRWPYGRISEQEGRFSHQVSSPETSGFLMEDVKGLTNLELADALLTVAKQLQQWPGEIVFEGNMRIDGQVQIETQRRSSTKLRFRIQPATG